MATQLNVTREEFHIQVELLHASHTPEEVRRLYEAKRNSSDPWGIEHARLHAAWYLGHPDRAKSYPHFDNTQMIDTIIERNGYDFVGEPHGRDLGNG